MVFPMFAITSSKLKLQHSSCTCMFSTVHMSANQPGCFGGDTLRSSMFWLRSLPVEKNTHNIGILQCYGGKDAIQKKKALLDTQLSNNKFQRGNAVITYVTNMNTTTEILSTHSMLIAQLYTKPIMLSQIRCENFENPLMAKEGYYSDPILEFLIPHSTYQSCFHSCHLLVSQQSAEKTGFLLP